MYALAGCLYYSDLEICLNCLQLGSAHQFLNHHGAACTTGTSAPPVISTRTRPVSEPGSPLQPPAVRPRVNSRNETIMLIRQPGPPSQQSVPPRLIAPVMAMSVSHGKGYTMKEAWQAALNAKKHRWISLLDEAPRHLPSSHELVQLQISPLWIQHAMRLVAANAPSTLNAYLSAWNPLERLRPGSG